MRRWVIDACLLVCLVVIGLCAWRVVGGRPSHSECIERADHVLRNWQRDQLKQLDLMQNGHTITVFPFERAPAEYTQVRTEALLATLAYAQPRKVLVDVPEATRRAWGLVPGVSIVRAKFEGYILTLRVGHDSPTHAGRYAQVDGDNRVMVIGQDLAEVFQ